VTREEMDARAREIETELDNEADAGWASYPAELDVDYNRARLRVLLADGTVRLFQLDDVETFACPECGTAMVRSPSDRDFLMHVESTDCAPEPWPTPEEAR